MVRVGRVFSTAGVEIVTRPYLVEDELSALAQRCSEDWARWLTSENLISPEATPSSLEILNGGRFYYAKAAWDAVHPKQSCGLLQLRAKRGHMSADTFGGAAHNDQNLEPGMEIYRSPGSDWCVRMWDFQGSFTNFTGPVLVGDTIATGTTLVGVLGWLVEKMVASKSVQDIHVFTIVGASEWTTGNGGVIEKLRDVDEVLQKHGKALTVCFCNATFGLNANGTDLNPCPTKGAEWLPEALEMTKKQVGNFPLENLKCGVWDWGDRFTKALHHLEEVTEHYNTFGAVAPAYITAGLRERLEARETISAKRRRKEDSEEQANL